MINTGFNAKPKSDITLWTPFASEAPNAAAYSSASALLLAMIFGCFVYACRGVGPRARLPRLTISLFLCPARVQRRHPPTLRGRDRNILRTPSFRPRICVTQTDAQAGEINESHSCLMSFAGKPKSEPNRKCTTTDTGFTRESLGHCPLHVQMSSLMVAQVNLK